MGTIRFNRASGKPIVSERLGWAFPRWDWEHITDNTPPQPVRVWRALVCLRCAVCGEWIRPGALFVRRVRYDATGAELHHALPTCRACYPFDWC